MLVEVTFVLLVRHAHRERIGRSLSISKLIFLFFEGFSREAQVRIHVYESIDTP